MPRIFNAIRQCLLNESRLTRYLVYAIGEIVLVVNRSFIRSRPPASASPPAGTAFPLPRPVSP